MRDNKSRIFYNVAKTNSKGNKNEITANTIAKANFEVLLKFKLNFFFIFNSKVIILKSKRNIGINGAKIKILFWIGCLKKKPQLAKIRAIIAIIIKEVPSFLFAYLYDSKEDLAAFVLKAKNKSSSLLCLFMLIPNNINKNSIGKVIR